MTAIHRYSAFFEKKKEKEEYTPEEEIKDEGPKEETVSETPPPDEKPDEYNPYKTKGYVGKYSFDYGEVQSEKEDNPDEPFDVEKILKKGKKEKKKVKKEDIEKHPFFKYMPKEIWKAITGKEEVTEDEVVYNIDELPIQLGDYVVCDNFDDLNANQVKFLKVRPYHKVKSVCDARGRYYQTGEPHIDVGYKMPFKMFRFKKIDRTIDARYKILFLQFDLPIDLHGEKDKHNYFKGHSTMSDVFIEVFKDRLPDSYVDFCNYDDVYKAGGDYYIDDLKLKEYNFVFFGFMSNFSTIVKMLIHYLEKHNVPYLKYGTYKDLDNKAYEMHLIESLGYPYIPSILATKLTKRVVDHVKEFGFPVIVKDVTLNRGEGVSKIEDMPQLMKSFGGSYGGYNSRLMLIQKYIPNDGDYRVISIKNKVELVIKKERIAGSKEFRANVARGGKAVKGSLPKHIIDMCEDISHHLVCDIVGFDIIQNKVTREYYVMETNSSPHFPTFSVISEINIPVIIVDYIIDKIKKRRN